MTETKDFPTANVLSVVCDRLMSEGGIAVIYEILNWMTGESIYTHQIPRIAGEATPAIIAMCPGLSQAVKESRYVDGENWREWLAVWEARYGTMIAVPKLNADQHERIDPLSELAERFHPDKIIVLKAE